MKNHRKFKCIALVLLNLLLLPGAMLHAAMNPPGNALQLNGTSQYVNIPDANSLDLTTNYTLECWFKADSFGSLRSLISKYHTGGANGYLLRLNGTELDFDQMTTSGLNLQAGQWYHVAAVNSGGTRHLYVNGVDKTLSGTATTVVANTDPVRLASEFGSRYFAGQLDEVRIWNTSRTQAEIQQGMYHTLGGGETGLVAYYQFDQTSGTTLPDLTTHANTGTLVNTPAWTASGVPVNHVLSFNGTNQYVNIPDANSLDLTTNYTLETWFKADSFGAAGNLRGLIDKYQTAGSCGYLLRLNGTELDFDELKTSGLSLQIGQWYHVAAVNSGGTRHLYVNGVEKTISGTGYTVVANTNDLRLGCDYSNRYFAGQLDEVRIWNTVRTQVQIQDAMHQGLAGSETGLVAYYRFNQGAGTSLPDATAYANTGTLVNTPTWSAATVPFANLVAGSTNIRGTWSSNHTSLASGRLSIVNSSETGTDFAVFAHDNGTDNWQNTDLPAGVAKRLTRVWRTETSGSVTGDIRIDTTGLADLGDGSMLRLLSDGDGVFSNATTVTGSYSAPYYTVAAQSLPSGANYTLALSLPAQELPISDSFETAGLGGWATQQVNATDGAWQNGSVTPDYTPPHSGDSMAVFNSWSADNGSQTRLYRTASFAIPASYPVATLRFWVYHDPYAANSNDRVQPQISLNGSTWVDVGAAVSRYTGNTGWAQVSVDLSPYIGQSTVYLGFLGISERGDDLCLDDVSVGSQPMPPTVTTKASTQISSSGATLNGTINAHGASTTVTFEYGLTTAYGTMLTPSQSPVTGSSSVTVTADLSGLSADTLYHYRVKGTNSGGTAYGEDLTFTTTPLPPTVTTNPATQISASGAILNGMVNASGASTTVTFEYGLTNAYGTTATASQSPVSGNSDVAVSAAISGLSANTLYHYRVKGVNNGGTVYGDDLTFTTFPPPPTVVTTAASPISSSGATINGTVNANGASTTVTFEYGLTNAYGTTASVSQSPVTGTSAVSVTAAITGLSANTLYHYRVKGVNSSGTSYGDDLTFTTTTGGTVLFFRDGFEYANFGGWAVQQVNGTQGAWSQVGSGGNPTASPHGGGSMAMFNSFDADSGSQTRLYRATPFAIPASSSAATFRFWMYHDPAYSVSNDRVQPQISLDGNTWTNVGTAVSRYAASAGWAQVVVDLGAYVGQTTVYLGFLGISDYGENIYLDDVSVVNMPLPPTVTTNQATQISSSRATLNGTVNAHGVSTTVTFEYGPTNAYGSSVTASQSTVSGSSDVAVSAVISGLGANTLYHYRLKGESAGGIAYGEDLTFTSTTGNNELFVSDGFEAVNLGGWAATQVNGTQGAWSQHDQGTDIDVSPHGGSFMAQFNSYDAAAGSQTRLYRVAPFSIPVSCNSATLRFWMYHDTRNSGYNDRVQPQISFDGTTWTNIGAAISRYAASAGWAQASIDLSAYAGRSTVYIGFLGISEYGFNIYLDDVSVGAVRTGYDISASATEGGTISPSGMVAVPFNGTKQFALTTDSGFSFTGMTGTCPAGSMSGNTYTTGTITADCTLTANFTVQHAANALRFNGTNQYVDVGNGGTLNLTGAMTIEAWVKPTSQYNMQTIFGHKNGGLANPGYALFINSYNTTDAKLRFETQSAAFSTSSAAITWGVWQHVAVTWDGTTAHIYVNGVEQAAGGSVSLVSSTVNGHIGDISNNGGYYNGVMDELRIWNTARTPNQIQDAMHRELSGSESGLTAYYQFNQAAGTTLPDLTANHLNGTLVNSPAWISSVVPLASSIADRFNLRAVWPGQNPSLLSGRFSLSTIVDSSAIGGDYAIVGHDNAADAWQTANVPSGIGWRLGRVWKTEAYGYVSGSRRFDITGLDGVLNTGNLRLLKSSNADFSGATVVSGSFTSPVFSCGSSPISGGEYYTLGLLREDHYTVTATADAHGTIDPSGNVVVPPGGTQNFHITPATYYHVADVTVNGVSVGAVTDYSWTNVTADGTIHATFAPDLSANGTPHWWLAQHGWTTNFDAAEAADTDGDGQSAAQEYLADTDPTSSTSVFRVTEFVSNPSVAVTFASSTNRLYTLYRNTGLAGTWLPVSGQSDVPGTGNPLTLHDTTSPQPSHCFYRVGVHVP